MTQRERSELPSCEEVRKIALKCGLKDSYSIDHGSTYFDVSDDKLERFAAAMYEAGAAKGAEDMRERAATKCDYEGTELARVRIINLPITPTNT